MTDKAPERIWAHPKGAWFGALATNETTEYVRADIYNEAKMQSLADLGQAQDALDAQKKAEAERDKLRAVVQLADDNLTNLQPKIADLVPKDWVPVFDGYIDPVIKAARAALGETEK